MSVKIIKKPKIVFQNGKPAEVILSWQDFGSILENIEDACDLSEIKKIKKAKPNFKNFEDFLNEKRI